MHDRKAQPELNVHGHQRPRVKLMVCILFLRYALTDSGLRIRVVTRTRTYFAVPDPSRAKASCAHRKLVGRTANRPNNRVYDCLVVSGNADMFSAAAYRHLCCAPRLACLSTGPVRLYLCIVYRGLANFGTQLVVVIGRVQRYSAQRVNKSCQ